MSINIARELETQIGAPPGHTILISNHEQRIALRAWCIAQGVDAKSVNRARDESLTTAYKSHAYLDTWRKNKPGSLPSFVADSDIDGSDVDLDFLKPETPSRNANADIFANLPQKPSQPQVSVGEADIASAADVVLSARIEQARRALERTIDEKIKNTKLELSDDAKRLLREISATAARETAEDVVKRLLPPRRIEVLNTATQQVIDVGVQHKHFERLLKACNVRLPSGHRANIWLTGPTGSGKTTAAQNVAKALSLEFGSDGSLDADYKVLGYRDANGNVIETTFLRLYEHGGIYVADEIDNWLPSALLSLNSALANGWVFANGRHVVRHKDFICIACANTWGLGATNEYVGRSKLDAASLDRFHPKLDWPVDEDLEMEIAKASSDVGDAWCRVVQGFRAKAKTQGLHVIISPRATFSGIGMLQAGFTHDEVVDSVIAAGLKPEQKTALGIGVTANNIPTSSAYGAPHTALAKFRRAMDANQMVEAIRIYRLVTGEYLGDAKVKCEAMKRGDMSYPVLANGWERAL